MARFAAVLLLLFPASAFAINLAGRVADTANAGLDGIEVSAWQLQAYDNTTALKKLVNVKSVVTAPGANGAFTLTALPAGRYYLHARMSRAASGNWADRWYDLDGSGYVFADADPVELIAADVSLPQPLRLEPGGGLDGRVFAAGALFPGIRLRAEWQTDPRVHHDDVSQGLEHPGEFHFRGLKTTSTPPGGVPYNLLTYSPTGAYETTATAIAGIAPNANATVDDLTLVPMAADPFEPNNTLTDLPGSFASAARAPHAVFSTGAKAALIAAGDVDTFCFYANDDDRFEATVTAPLGAIANRSSPWVDPYLGLSGPRGFATMTDDDSAGGWDSRITTPEVAAGRYCALVTTFPDVGFTGASQASAGRYVLTLKLLNRSPKLSALIDGAAPPPMPQTVLYVEGSVVTVQLAMTDADADVLTASAELIDANGADVAGWDLAQASDGAATFTWTVPQDASTAGPYEVRFAVADHPANGEASRSSATLPIALAVRQVAVPTLVAPADGASVATGSPTFELQDLVDNTQTNVQYEIELYDATGAKLPQSGFVDLDPSGHMAYTPPPLAENARIAWRARAVHGLAYSAWTPYRHLLIDAVNDAPPSPVLLKPADGDEVLVRRPGFSASNVQDPEGEAVSIVFELARDAAFTQPVEASDPVAVSPVSLTTAWAPQHDLAWGAAYSARAYAIDARGARSAPSNVVSFAVRADGLPAQPQFADPVAPQCSGGKLTARPATLPVHNVVDPDGEAVTLELALFDFAADPATAQPLVATTRGQQPGGVTALDVSTAAWTEDRHYRARVRAGDGSSFTGWTECDFTLDESPASGGDGGTGSGGDGGTGGAPDGGSDGGSPGTRGGCSSAGAVPAIWALAALLLARRRSSRR